MQNFTAIEKRARQEANGDISFIKETKYGETSLTFWRSVRIKPARKVVVLECANGCLIVPNRNFEQFELMLIELQPSLSDLESFIQIFSETSPSKRKVLVQRDQVLEKYQDIWNPVTANSSGISFFCEDLLNGAFEQIKISHDYSVMVKILGPGRKYTLR